MDDETLIGTVGLGPAGEVRITLGKWQGQPRLDVRHYFKPEDADNMVPTKRGVSVGVDRAEELSAAIIDAVGEIALRKQGAAPPAAKSNNPFDE